MLNLVSFATWFLFSTYFILWRNKWNVKQFTMTKFLLCLFVCIAQRTCPVIDPCKCNNRMLWHASKAFIITSFLFIIFFSSESLIQRKKQCGWCRFNNSLKHMLVMNVSLCLYIYIMKRQTVYATTYFWQKVVYPLEFADVKWILLLPFLKHLLKQLNELKHLRFMSYYSYLIHNNCAIFSKQIQVSLDVWYNHHIHN